MAEEVPQGTEVDETRQGECLRRHGADGWRVRRYGSRGAAVVARR